MNESKFNGMGEIYAQFRPNYPQEFLDYLFSKVEILRESVIADIGAGTGILTKQLLECGNTVYAVEPNADMRTVAENNLGKFKKFVCVNGTAENTTLANDSVDFITVAQAFHWFDRQSFRAECRRILKTNGKVILVWNSRDDRQELVIANDRINRKYCPDFKGFSEGMRGAIAEGDFSDFFIGDYVIKVFVNPLHFNEQGFIGRNLSSSYALKKSDKNYADYVDELKMLFDKYSQNSVLVMPNLTKCYIGNL